MPENDPRPLLPLWVAVLASIAGGLVYDLGFPGASIWPLAFVGIALALVSLIGRSSWSAALVGLAFGLAFYLQQVSLTALYLGPVPWLALSVLESLFVAGGGVLIALAYRWVPAGEHLAVGAPRVAAAARRRPLVRARGGDRLDPVRRVPVGPGGAQPVREPVRRRGVLGRGPPGSGSSWSPSSRA